MNGLTRYNEIQKALSSVRKEKGWKLQVGTFQDIASKIYHKTKSQPIKHIINNIDIIVDDIPTVATPIFPPELLDWNYYFDFDANASSGNGIWNPDLLGQHTHIIVKSPQLFGDNFPVDASILSYQDHFKDFSDYCNANRMYFPDKYGPMWKFTEPEYDWNEGKYLTYIEIDNLYGYEPGMGGTVNEEEVIDHIKEPSEEIPTPSPKEEKATEPSKEDKEIIKIQAETEKIKASKERLSELNKAVKNLDSQLKRKLITKKQYSKYLGKLYGM